ncbi:hypothetical protein QBC45DRAFT_409536 [Copromyces sp. CBS 386.78]|nr:hypothetical protein QBC45DRAFT_409536 [Copromyces sp. CBS 386.78]
MPFSVIQHNHNNPSSLCRLSNFESPNMPSKNVLSVLASLLSILQFSSIFVTAVNATSSFRTQTLSANSLPASTLSPIVNRTSDNEVLESDVISPGSYNHTRNFEHKARDGGPSKGAWLYNNCHTSVSNGEPLYWGTVDGVQDGIHHLDDIMTGKEIPSMPGWRGGVVNHNCGQVACNKEHLTAIRWCNYHREKQDVTWQFIKEGAKSIMDDPNCKKDNNAKVVGEAIFWPGITVQVTSVDQCSP